MIEVPRKYKLSRYGLVFLAYNRNQIQEYLNRQFSYWQLRELKVNDSIQFDVNLINYNYNQYKFTPDRIPFSITAIIKKDCPFCKKTVVKKYGSYECYHCTSRIIRDIATQVRDADFQILDRCCGTFVDGFYEELNKNVLSKM